MRGTGAASKRNQTNDSTDWWSDLPFDLQNVKVTSGSRPIGFRFSPFIFNIEANLGGNEIVACGEDSSAELAMTKAMAELTERSAMMSWSNQATKKYRTSSGWAAHDSKVSCRQSAILELIERDAVLVQWYSAKPFIEIESTTLPQSIRNWIKDELYQSEYPNLRLLISTEGIGPSVSCLLMDKNGYGVSGHATKATLLDSIESAIAETCRAAHLAIRKSFWEDSVLLKNSIAGRIDPGTHAVYYAYHEAFPQWMFGKVVEWNSANQIWHRKMMEVDMDSFHFEAVLEDPFFVGVASHPQILEVSWGSTNEAEITNKMKGRISRLDNLNLKPHIVS